MPDINDYHAFKSTSGGSGGSSGGGKGFGCGWIVIVIVVLMLVFFIADGASWDAIDTLLGLGLLAYLCSSAGYPHKRRQAYYFYAFFTPIPAPFR